MKNIGLLLLFVGLLNPLYGNIIDRAYKGDLAGVQKCVENGADINFENKNGITALLNASGLGHLNIIKYLIDNGADIKDRKSVV